MNLHTMVKWKLIWLNVKFSNLQKKKGLDAVIYYSLTYRTQYNQKSLGWNLAQELKKNMAALLQTTKISNKNNKTFLESKETI